jgi:response regulator RpfG family c-di-GMP phosphodiesterase
MKILVVDDHVENRYLLEVLLKAHGHAVISANDGVKALERLRQESAEMIISDILMPRMDGYRLCRECKRDPALKTIPFIFITAAYTGEKDEEFALSLGADRFIRRPIEPDALTAIIQQVIDEYQSRIPPVARPTKEETRYLAEYSERVESQLQQKVMELEQEIAERKRLERALRALSECNQILVRSSDEAQLLMAMCRALVDVGGYRFAWVGFAEHDEAKTVTPVAVFGSDGDYVKDAHITWADTERGRGPTGTAIRSGVVQVNQDFAHNPNLAPWREVALRHGFASSIALPLTNDTGVFGALMIYSGEPDAFNHDEVALLTELAADLAYGITSLRARVERAQYVRTIRRNLEETIQAIAAVVEMRDPYTAGHEKRVAALASAIGRELGWPEKQIDGLHVAGSIHDVGKIGIPTEILTKPGYLAGIEFDMVKIHPQAGYDILHGIDFPWPVAQTVLQHHERLDGSGYPRGLKDGAILPEARVLAVADVVESIASHRPYRAALGLEAALDEITTKRDKLYDPQAVDACLILFREKGFTFPR